MRTLSPSREQRHGRNFKALPPSSDLAFENKAGFVAIHRFVTLGEGGLTAKTRFALKDYRHLFVVGESPPQKAKVQEGGKAALLK